MPQHIKGCTANTSEHNTQWLKAESFFSQIRNKISMHTFTTLTQHNIGSNSQGNHTRKGNKKIQTGNKEVKFLLFADK